MAELGRAAQERREIAQEIVEQAKANDGIYSPTQHLDHLLTAPTVTRLRIGRATLRTMPSVWLNVGQKARHRNQPRRGRRL